MATTFTCPDGHTSAAGDYCDTCGLPIGASSAPPAPAADPDPVSAAPAPAVGACPNCGTPRQTDEAFCEVCGLDYATGDLPEAPAAPGPATTAAASEPSGWSVAVSADRAWFTQQEAEAGVTVEFPRIAPARTIELAGDVASIGRRDERDGWYPTIDLGHPVDDPAVSRHHGELRRTADGWDLVDTGSTNGTSYNGAALASNTPQPLADGDTVHLGSFTKLTVRAPTAEAG